MMFFPLLPGFCGDQCFTTQHFGGNSIGVTRSDTVLGARLAGVCALDSPQHFPGYLSMDNGDLF